MITSSKNPKVKLIKELISSRKKREKEGKFVIEGIHLVLEAIKAKSKIDFIVYSEGFDGRELLSSAKALGIRCYEARRSIVRSLSEVKTPQGVMAVVREDKFSLEDLFRVPNPLIVYSCEIQDPGNLGTMIRTADAVGASGIIISKGTVDVYNPKVLRSTMGSVFHLPIVNVEYVRDTIDILKRKGVKIVATSIDAERNYWSIDYRESIAILFGNEAAGLPKDIIDLSGDTVKIPMLGKAESLNVGVAASIVLYEALRQRIKG